MSNIQIIVDSTASMARDYAEINHIEVVPLSIIFNEKDEKEGFPGEFDAFYNALKQSDTFPTTSQPSVQAFAAAYEKAIAQGKEIIVIVLSAKLSGTFSSAYTAAQMVAAEKISIIDSETSGPNLKAFTERALELSNQGKSRQEIVDIINVEKKQGETFFTVDTLDYLKKGGRLTSAQAFIGNMLNIKPIISLTKGVLESVGKVRGKGKAVEMLIANIPDHVKRICVCQIQNLEEANAVKDMLQAKYPNAIVTVDELSPVIGCHLGPKAIGVCYIY